ncbi:MAG: tRNA uracil 4-sulfurtransferase ThiI [Desulfurococcaceae archaeon]|nr:tRNA 4-thiouridine(8) synthase ThiI [Sulfolobales archaeon]MDW8170214.1 tRNA uracil 4-sulfurtransferase ThiI [Desulfurococcaceae archaeon]
MAIWVMLVRYGEVAIKGRTTRGFMERKLVDNLSDALNKNAIPYRKAVRVPGRIIIGSFSSEEEALNASEHVARVMGVVSVSPSVIARFTSVKDIVEKSLDFFRDRVKGNSFAVCVNRVGVHEFTSIDLEKAVGQGIKESTGLKVDLEKPDYTAYIEVRGKYIYLYDKVVSGPGGLPIGSEGVALSLFSGGIDSPVATWYAMRRGCRTDMVLFNLGGEEQVRSVLKVAEVLVKKWAYGYEPRLHVVDLRTLVPRILLSSPESYVVIIVRRLMMKLASMLAEKIGAKALVTGENLGQVASQTLDNLYVISNASRLPVLRPLIGFDKDEIVKLAKRIGTYDYSIKVKEYCPVGTRRATTKATLSKVIEIEGEVGISEEDLSNVIESAATYNLWKISS